MWAAEQDRPDVAAKRRRWRRWQRFMDPARFVFLDETSTATKMVRCYGRSRPEKRLVAAAPHGPRRCSPVSGIAGQKRLRQHPPEDRAVEPDVALAAAIGNALGIASSSCRAWATARDVHHVVFTDPPALMRMLCDYPRALGRRPAGQPRAMALRRTVPRRRRGGDLQDVLVSGGATEREGGGARPRHLPGPEGQRAARVDSIDLGLLGVKR